VLLLLAGVAACSTSRDDAADEAAEQAVAQAPAASGADHRNATYVLAGRPVHLDDGVATGESVSGSAAVDVTRYFGNEARGDLDRDGREDVVFLLTQETGGSGTYYYVVAALRRDEGYAGSHGVLLGDRVAPQSTEVHPDGVVVVSYADRARGESFATPPSVARSIWLKIDTATLQFGEVVQDFEGEADPERMSLDMKVWSWIRTTYASGDTVEPRRVGAFTLTFRADGTFSATTDCNAAAGSYESSGSVLRLGEMAATQMFCDGAQESAFIAMLGAASAHRFTSRGELVLTLEPDAATMVFR
jgi:heat shock protein HslJ